MNEQKQAEERLREAEERFRITAETSNDLIHEWDLKKSIQWFGRIDEMLGYGPGGFPRTLDAWENSLHPEDHDRTMSAIQSHLEGRAPFDIEYRIRRKDGVYRWWAVRGVAARGPDGKPVRWIGTVTDVTERKRTEEILERIEWMLSPKPSSAAIDEAQDSAVDKGYGDLTELNHGGLILRSVGKEMLRSISSEFLDLMETSSAVYEKNGDYACGIFSSKWCRMMDRASRNLCACDDNAAALSSGKWLCHESCWTRCSKEAIAKGAPVDIECNGGMRLCAVPIFAGGEVIGAINVGHEDPPKDPVRLRELAEAYHVDYDDLVRVAGAYDSRPAYIIEMARNRLYASARLIGILVERKQYEDRLHGVLADLERSNRNLEHSNKDLEQFAYVASHDLQEPLRMVASYTQLLADRYKGQLDEKANMYIDYAVDGAVRMQQLINDLLTYSRIGTQGRQPEPIDVRPVLSEACRNLQTAIEESGAIVTDDDLPTVRADAGQIALLFQNLIGNAIKFHGADPPRVHVSARDLGREWCFSLKDNGIGMESKYADRVFVIFQRLHTQQEYPGTGIGLAVCKRIVERHGGRIWLESSPGEGSTFFFTIPK
ncbi:MAG: PAS domain-containing protein [Candidatus Eremiobacteraeota bacterium]|nr:PAS domain-containing protein [Candidatus Eremiobacteraeota bacterium]